MQSSELQKKKRACLVFGKVVLEDDEVDNSLVYSSSSPDSNITLESEMHANTTTTPSSSYISPPSILDSSSQDNRLAAKTADAKAGPFAKVLMGDEKGGVPTTDKENLPKPMSAIQFPKNQRPQKGNLQKHHVQHFFRNQRSPLRRDLVKQTQDAINRASASIHQSINAPRLARQDSFRYKRHMTAKVRQEWEDDREEAIAFHREAQKQRLELLQAKRDLSSQCSQARARRQQHYRLQHLQAIEKESLFRSSVYRDHQAKLREGREQRRRMSVEAKASLRANHRQGQEQMRLARVEEDCAVFDERHAASVALRETKQKTAQERRKSFAFRNGDARRIRELHKQLEQERLLEQHESYLLKWEGEKDAEETKRRWEQERRHSLADRAREILQQRDADTTRALEAMAAEHASFALKWAGERDVKAYREQLERERRQSLALRNQEGMRQRKEDSERKAQELAELQASISLKLSAERDADDYRKLLDQQRRESLARRNEEARKQREEANAQRQAQLQADQESYELKWAGEKDAEDYLKEQEKLRRESLAHRNKEGHHQREQQKLQRAAQLSVDHASFKLKWAGERDVNAYHEQLRKQRRDSLSNRNKERSRHAKVMQELQALAREKEMESLVLKWAGENDAKAYLAKIEEERRQSLQLRGQQVLHHRSVEAEQREAELKQMAEDENMRSLDHREVEAYKQACASRDRTSLQYRRKEAQLQRLEEEERRQHHQRIDEQNFRLETLARSDVEAYITRCKQRRRLSLAFRAQEKRRQADWLRQQADMKREEQSREVRDRLLDRRYQELARHQERTRIAMDAVRHAGCSFNPFVPP